MTSFAFLFGRVFDYMHVHKINRDDFDSEFSYLNDVVRVLGCTYSPLPLLLLDATAFPAAGVAVPPPAHAYIPVPAHAPHMAVDTEEESVDTEPE